MKRPSGVLGSAAMLRVTSRGWHWVCFACWIFPSFFFRGKISLQQLKINVDLKEKLLFRNVSLQLDEK